MNKRQAHAEECRQKLLEAAIKLISQKGYDKTSIADITAECGMSVGNYYHYFISKESIVDAIELEPISKKLEALIADETLTATEKLREYLFFYADSDQNLYGVNFQKSWFAHHIKDVEAGTENKIDIRRKDIARLLQTGVDSGEYSKNLPVESTAEEIVFSLFGACIYYAMKGSSFDLTGWVKKRFDKLYENLLKAYVK